MVLKKIEPEFLPVLRVETFALFTLFLYIVLFFNNNNNNREHEKSEKWKVKSEKRENENISSPKNSTLSTQSLLQNIRIS